MATMVKVAKNCLISSAKTFEKVMDPKQFLLSDGLQTFRETSAEILLK